MPGWADAARAAARRLADRHEPQPRAHLRAQRGGSRALLTVGRVQTRRWPWWSPATARSRHSRPCRTTPSGRWCSTPAAASPPHGRRRRIKPAWTAKAALSIPPSPTPWWPPSGPAGHHRYKQEARSRTSRWPSPCPTLRLASAKFGYSAEDVLNACQALYETHKLTSYPRTGCAYLPESQHADAPRVLEAIKHVNPELAGLVDGADPRIKSKTWDDSKITAHHGIVPTMQKAARPPSASASATSTT